MQPDANASFSEQCSAAAVVFGLVSLVTCWWFPYGPTVGAVGTAFGLLAWWIGQHGERALLGTALAAFGTATGVALAWNYWQRVFGL